MRQTLRDHSYYFGKAKVQVSVKSIVVRFLGSNAATIDLEALNFCIQNHPNFANIPVCCDRVSKSSLS